MAEKIVAEGVEAHLGGRMLSVRPLGGGCIGEVYMVELQKGPPLVAKVDREGESRLEREAYMLRYLRQKSELPVPKVYHGSEKLLLMQFIEGNSRFTEGAERHAAELLARLHDITADSYGHERDTFIGALDQPNPPTKNWAEFSATTACCISRSSPTRPGGCRWKICSGWSACRRRSMRSSKTPTLPRSSTATSGAPTCWHEEIA